jgi:hypothetical protein
LWFVVTITHATNALLIERAIQELDSVLFRKRPVVEARYRKMPFHSLRFAENATNQSRKADLTILRIGIMEVRNDKSLAE